MDAAGFLSRVTPLDKWTYVVVCFTEGTRKKWVTKGFQTAADCVKFGMWAARKGADVYYALASFAQQGRVQEDGKLVSMRTQENAVALKSFWVDVDYNKGPYKDEGMALDAVLDFVATAKLPAPNLLVSSGNGFHVYWTLDAPLPKDQWVVLARNLANAARVAGLHADLQCTIDCARILRLPGTINHKDPANLKPVQIRALNPVDLPVATMQAALLPHAPSPALTSVPAAAGPVSDLAAGIEPIKRLSYAEHIVEACGVMKRVQETHGAEGGYEHWRGVLNLLAFCEDGDAYVTKLSEGHRTYDPADLQKHWTYAKGSKGRHGPTECATFAALPEFAPICQRCPHWGAIKTPWSVGHAKAIDLPPGYLRDERSIYKTVTDDEGNPKRVTVLRGDILNFKIAALAADEFEEQDLRLAFTYVSPPGRHYNVVMSYSDLPDARPAAQKFFGARGITLDAVTTGHFKELLMSWTQTLRDARKEQQGAIRAYGWHEHEGKVGFAFYDRITLEDGVEAPLGAIDRELRKLYSPKGANKEWRDTAEFFLVHAQPALRVMVASAFAAPLVPLAGASGLLLSVVSSKSGAGKSTAMKVAQSVWGAEQGINSLHDTPLSVQHKMAALRSLPVYWDEIRGSKNVESFIATVFQLSQGKDRSRLTQHVELREAGSWATMLTCASNTSILDTMANEQGGTDAGFLRTFELEATVGATDVSTVDMERAMMKLRDHYGTAGHAYAQFLAKNRKLIASAIDTEKARLHKATMATPDERFWISTIACLTVGAALATASGILAFDVPGIRQFLLETLARLRKQRGEETFASANDETSMVDVINRFLYDHSQERLLTDFCSQGGAFKGVGSMVSPKSERVAYHLATKTRILRVPRTVLRKWLHKQQIPRKRWLDEAVKTLGAQFIFSKFASGTPYASLGQVWCVDFPLTGPMAGVADDAAEALAGNAQLPMAATPSGNALHTLPVSASAGPLPSSQTLGSPRGS